MSVARNFQTGGYLQPFSTTDTEPPRNHYSATSAGRPQFDGNGRLISTLSAEEAYRPYFGVARFSQNQDPYALNSKESLPLPEAYHGKNPYAEQVLITTILSKEQWPITEVCPWRERDEMSWSYNTLIFDDHSLTQTPEESTSRLLTFHSSEREAFTRRKGLAFHMEQGFYSKPKGALFYAMHMAQIANATVETCCHEVVYKLLHHNYYEDHSAPYRHTGSRSIDEITALLAEECSWFAKLNKSIDGISSVFAKYQKVYSTRNQSHANYIILPEGTSTFIQQSPLKSYFFLSGERSRPRVGDEASSMMSTSEYVIRESRQFRVGEKHDNIDPTKIRQTIGSFYHHYPAHLETVPPAEYKTSMMDKGVLDWDANTIVRKSFAKSIGYSGLYENWESENPILSREFGEPYFEECDTWGKHHRRAKRLDYTVQNIFARRNENGGEFIRGFLQSCGITEKEIQQQQGFDEYKQQPRQPASQAGPYLPVNVSDAVLNALNSKKLSSVEISNIKELIRVLEEMDKSIGTRYLESYLQYVQTNNSSTSIPSVVGWGKLFPFLVDGSIIQYCTKNSSSAFQFFTEFEKLIHDNPSDFVGRATNRVANTRLIDANHKSPFWNPENEDFPGPLELHVTPQNSLKDSYREIDFHSSIFALTSQNVAFIRLNEISLELLARNNGKILITSSGHDVIPTRRIAGLQMSVWISAVLESVIQWALFSNMSSGDVKSKHNQMKVITSRLVECISPNYRFKNAMNNGMKEITVTPAAYQEIFNKRELLPSQTSFKSVFEPFKDIIRTILDNGSTQKEILVDRVAKMISTASTYMESLSKNQLQQNARVQGLASPILDINDRINDKTVGSVFNSFVSYDQKPRNPEWEQKALATVNEIENEFVPVDIRKQSQKNSFVLYKETYAAFVLHLYHNYAGTELKSYIDCLKLIQLMYLHRTADSGMTGGDLVKNALSESVVKSLFSEGFDEMNFADILAKPEILQKMFQIVKAEFDEKNANLSSALVLANYSSKDGAFKIADSEVAESLHLRKDSSSQDRYELTEDTVREVLMRTSVGSGKFLKWSLSHDVPVSIGLRVVNPWIELLMGWGVFTTGGGKIGYMNYHSPDFRLGTDSTIKTIMGHFTCYFTCEIENPQYVVIAPNLICLGYKRGGGTAMWDPLSAEDKRDYTASIHSGSARRSHRGAFVIPTDSDEHLTVPWFDVTGRMNDSYHGNPEVHQCMDYRLKTQFCHKWGIKESKQVTPHGFTAIESMPRVNTLCMEAYQNYYEHEKKSFSGHSLNKGHMGPKIYTGCVDVFNGRSSYLEQPKYADTNSVQLYYS